MVRVTSRGSSQAWAWINSHPLSMPDTRRLESC